MTVEPKESEKVLIFSLPDSSQEEVRHLVDELRSVFPDGLGYELVFLSKTVHVLTKSDLEELLERL